MPRARSGIARRRSRLAATAAIAAALVALLIVVTTGGGSRHYRVMMQNAGQLVRGDLVRIGGVPAGKVTGLDLTPDGQAQVDVAIDKSWGALHDGTTVTVRASGIATVTGRYVDISPGPTFRPAMPDNAAIGVDHTTSIVDIDQVLNSLGPPTRRSLQKTLHGFAGWYAGREQQANLSAQYFPATLQAATHLFRQLDQDSGTLDQFIQNTGTALTALARRRQTLTDLVSNTRATARAVGANNRSLSAALTNLPPALRTGSEAFAAVRPALGDLRSLIAASDPASRRLAPFLRDLRPVVSRAVPAFSDFRVTFDRPGRANDLLDALRLLPSLGKLTGRAFPQAVRTLDKSEPVLAFIRPYTPDLVGFVRSFGSAAATYDANGHYARTVPIFDAFSFQDNPAGGVLIPKSQSERGKSPDLKSGMLRRCPGAAFPGLSDGSGPFVDNGPLAAPDCNRGEVIK